MMEDKFTSLRCVERAVEDTETTVARSISTITGSLQGI
jgi:hypothetical protein